MINSPSELRDRMAAWGSRLALVTDQGHRYAYADVLEMADLFLEYLGSSRQLVFIEASNRPEAIGAYVACLTNGYPVYLFGEKDTAALPELIARYRPHRLIYPNATQPIQFIHDDPLEMHPNLAVLLSTSGSTGSPKFVKLSYDNVEANARSIAEYLNIDSDDRAITSLQFNYSYGLSVVNSHLFSGASLLLSDASVIDERFWRSIGDYGATSFAGVPYTFELLEKIGDEWAASPSLRIVTQAGGALSARRIEHLARLGEAHGWQFYVMYGQTECAPRIAYLPPEKAISHSRCIGIAIPGGELTLLKDDGATISEPDMPGELVYSGPNVMLGYAADAEGLLAGLPPAPHRTGDVACRTADGLYYITGRISRFVKPFGLRVNLDELQEKLRSEYPDAVCTGTDDIIVVALPGEDGSRNAPATASLSAMLRLPEACFRIVNPHVIPRLSNGKIDFKAILADGEATLPRRRPGVLGTAAMVLSGRFVRQVLDEIWMIIGLRAAHWHSIAHIYATILNLPDVGDNVTFVDLAGDSLSYVQVTVALEEYLGGLPENWESRTVADLEEEAASASSI